MLNGQTKIVSSDVNHQTSTSVTKSSTPNAGNGNNMAVNDQQGQSSNRAKDDAMVSYVFQRPNDSDFQNYGKSSRWFAGEESNLIDVRGVFRLFLLLFMYVIFSIRIMSHLTPKIWKLVSLL